jgi:hypothetical protein
MKTGDLVRSRHDGTMGLIVDRAMNCRFGHTPKWEVMWFDIPEGRAPTTYEHQRRITTVLDVLPRGMVQ